MRQAAHFDDVARQAAAIVGTPANHVVELRPLGTVRTFRADHGVRGQVVVRVDENPTGDALIVEGMVLDALQTAIVPPLSPAVLARGLISVDAGEGERPFLAYPWIPGPVLERASASARAPAVGVAFAQLHAGRVMDLYGRLPRERPLTLLVAFRRAVEEMKAWLAARELDGLGQDLLTLALSDLQRALRPFCIAQDHLFLTARRRVLCHGRAAPAFLVVRDDADASSPLCFVGLEGACLGDAADDLASFSLRASLDEAAEEAMLRAYLEELGGMGRLERRFLPRYFARRTLGLFAQPMARLDAIARMKRGELPELGDPVAAIEEQSRQAYEELARAMNGLRDLGGRARPVSVPEVVAMGRLLSIEELLLAHRRFRIAIIGQPYVGKTEIAARLALRLKHRLVGTSSLSRALALIEQDMLADNGAPPEPAALVRALFRRGFVVEPRMESPFYRVRLEGRDVTDELRAGALHARGDALLADATVRAGLREALLERAHLEGIIVEGAHAAELVGDEGHVFHLNADAHVRRARLISHRGDQDSDEEASALLAALDARAPAPGPGVVQVDVATRTAAAATLEILWHLLPPERRPAADLSGRAPR